MRILIVEDCEDTREMLATVARRGTKAEVATACSYSTAEPLLITADVLCTDVNLGGEKTGLDLVAAFKEMKPWGQVIVLTGSEVPKTKCVDQVLRKPTFPEAVHQAMKKAVRKADVNSVFLRATEAMAVARKTIERSRSLLSLNQVYSNHAHPA